MTTKTVIIQNWEESERGWGTRPDGFTVHLDKEQHKKYVQWFYQKHNNADAAPDSYTRVYGDPIEVEVDGVLYDRIAQAMKDLYKGKHPVYALRGRESQFATSPMRSLKETDIVLPPQKRTIHLNYIGQVDANDIGRKTFQLSELLTEDDLPDDPLLELSVELVTENTNGQLAARVRLAKA